MKLLLRWIIIALAVAAAVYLVPGIQVSGTNGWITVGVMAVVLGLVNAIIRPVLSFLSCGLIIITLGLFTLVINAVTFQLAAWITNRWFDLGFYVDGWMAAFLGSLIVSVVTLILSAILIDKKRD